jgi:citrate lyase beta subunit
VTRPANRVPRLGEDDLTAIDAIVAPADERTARLYPGDQGGRQPVHTVYVPADRVTPDLAPSWGKQARELLDRHAPDPGSFAGALRLSEDDEYMLGSDGGWQRLLAKLDTEPIEDLRIDLEDGYGARDDETEDRDAVAAAQALVQAGESGIAPPFSGVRLKSLEAATRRRGLRTLDLVVGTLVEAGGLPEGWVVTLPKVTSLEQVEAMVEVCARLETAYGLPDHRLRFEIQVETPQAVLGYDGTVLLPRMIHAGDGRVSGLHFGTYDYTAALGISGEHQAMDHPVADHAKQAMALAAAQTGVRLSDGSSNVLGPDAFVPEIWAEHTRLVRRSLARGLYQGWDLGPVHLPSRFAATFLFFSLGHQLETAIDRVRAYLGHEGFVAIGYLDEPATAQALASFLVRGVDCGAVEADRVGGAAALPELRELAARRFG